MEIVSKSRAERELTYFPLQNIQPTPVGLLYHISDNGMTPRENSPPVPFPPPFGLSLSLERAHVALWQLVRQFPFVTPTTTKHRHAAALEAEEVQK